MSERKNIPPPDENENDLRRRAEQFLGESKFPEESTTAENLHRLLHELDVHQIELQMQNEEMRRSQAELEASRDRYADLYDFVPVGYVTLDEAEKIVEANLTAAQMIGHERGRLLGNLMLIFVAPSGKADFLRYLRRCKKADEGAPVEAEVELLPGRLDMRWVLLRCMAVNGPDTGGRQYRMTITDITARRRGEQTLRDALARAEQGSRLLTALMEHVPEGITIADAPDAKVRMVSRYGEELLGGPHAGQTAAEVAAQWSIYDEGKVRLLSEDELPLVRAVRRGEIVRGQELIQLNTHGYPLSLLCNAAPIRNEKGEITGGIVVWRDITERKQAEEALRESEQRYRTLFESMSEGFSLHEIICDGGGNPVDYRFLEVNPAFEHFTGLKAGDVTGRTVREVLPDIEPFWIERFGQVALTGRPDHFESYSGALDRWYDVYASSPAPGRFAAIFLDITDRKRMEQTLRESRQDLTRAQAVGHIGSWRLDVQKDELRWSEENHRIFGVPVGTPMNYEKFLAIVHPDDRRFVAEQWSAALRGEPYDIEHRIVVDGRVKWVRERAELEFDGPALRGGFGTTQDVTEKKLAAEALQKLNETLEQRVAERTATAERRARDLRRLAVELNLAEHRERKRLARLLHDDLQQLLLAIRLRLPVLTETQGERQRREREKLDKLLLQCMKLSRDLTQELSPPVIQYGTLEDMFRWLAKSFAEKHELKVEVEAPGRPPAVTEPIRAFLFQAVRELLFNVVKHAESRQAHLCLEADDKELSIQVRDGGKGFDGQTVDLQLDQPAGFGLFNIRERLEAMQGRLEVESPPGGGARFRMVLPLSVVAIPSVEPPPIEPLDRRLSPARTPRPDGETVRLMVVDDQELVRQGFVTILQQQDGFEVVGQACNGEEAVRLVEDSAPDVIVMDVQMPAMDGIEATRRIKRLRPATRVVALSLHEEEAITRAMTDAGADAYIFKHAPARKLIETIRRLHAEQAGE